MQLPLQITFRGLTASPTLEDRIRASALKLEQFHRGIMRCHVTVEATSRDHHIGHHFQVQIDLTVPGAEVVASRGSSTENGGNENVYVAVRDAFAAMTRQLEDHNRKLRGDARRRDALVARPRF